MSQSQVSIVDAAMRKEAAATLSEPDSPNTRAESREWNEMSEVKEGFTVNDQLDMQRMGKKQEFRRNFR